MWRETGSPLRFMGCDARVLFPMVLWALHMAWSTFYVAVVGILVFAVAERFGLTVPAALRTCAAIVTSLLATSASYSPTSIGLRGSNTLASTRALSVASCSRASLTRLACIAMSERHFVQAFCTSRSFPRSVALARRLLLVVAGDPLPWPARHGGPWL